MIRLPGQIEKNSPQEYDKVFQERKGKANWQDTRRWKELIKFYKGGKLIDLGCLDSQIWALIKDFSAYRNGFYYGIDSAEGAIREMNEKYGWANARFLVGDVYDTKLKSDLFDYAVLGEILEHLSFPDKALKEGFRILKPNGIMAISVPLEEIREIGAVDLERHLWSFDKQDIMDLVKPYSDKIRFKILRSKWFLKYKYCWPQLLCWVIKK